MIKTLKKYEDHHTDNQTEIDHVVSEYLSTFERKMLIFESNWDTGDVFNNMSVYPFLSNIPNILGNDKYPVKVGLRHFDSSKGLSYYLRYGSGVVWEDSNFWGTSVIYIGSHGKKSGLIPTIGTMEKNELIDTFDKFGQFPTILFFGGCGVFKGLDGDVFGKRITKSSQVRAVLGFTSPNVDFLRGTICEMLFLTRFYGVLDDDPFKRLGDIYSSVMDDFKPSEKLGFTIFLNESFG